MATPESLDQIAESLHAEGKLNGSAPAPAPASPSPSRPVAGTAAHAAMKQAETEAPPAKKDDAAPRDAAVKAKLAGAPVMQLHPDGRVNDMMNDPAYRDKNAPGHREQVAAVAEALRAIHGEDGDPLNPTSPQTLDDQRKAFKLDFHPDASLPTQELRDAWNHADEADFLAAAKDWNLNNSTVGALYEFLQDQVVMAGGPDKVDRATAVKAFEEKFAKDLSPGQRRRLVSWYFSNEDRAPVAE